MLYAKHMIRTQVFLPETTYQQIRIQAELQNKPAAQIIREALESGIKPQNKGNAGDALLQLAGLKAKGPRDLSKNIDKYLYQK